MTKNDQERVIIWRRILENEEKHSLLKLSDEELLDILNTTVLPNTLSLSNMKFTMFFSYLLKKKDYKNFIKKLDIMFEILSPAEKDLLKFGLFHGFDSYNWRYQMGRYVKTSTDIEKGELFTPKDISSNTFEQIFDFIYKIIYKGEKNERFPRI